MNLIIHGAIVSRVIGCVLLTSFALKYYDFITTYGQTWEASRSLSAVLLMTEFTIGCVCLAGFFPLIAQVTCVVVFLGFIVVNLTKILNGERDCGCFGPIQMSPWITLALDVFLLTAAMLSQQSSRGRSALWTRRAIVFCFLLLVGVTATGLMAVASKGIGDAAIFNEPASTWVGKELPLDKFAQINERLNSGKWYIAIYNWDCADCRAKLPSFLGDALHSSGHGETGKIGLLTLSEDQSAVRSSSAIKRGRLQLPQLKYKLTLPVFVHLSDGVVVRVGRDPQELFSTQGGEANSSASAGFPDYLSQSRRMYLSQIACGPLALLAILHKFDISIDPDDVNKLLKHAGEKGVDMLTLKRLAEAYGIYSIGVEVSVSDLKQIAAPAIVHLNGIGFAAVLGYGNDHVLMSFPLQSRSALTYDLLEQSFGKVGKALICLKDQTTILKLAAVVRESGSKTDDLLSFSKSMVTAGRIQRYTWEDELLVSNVLTRNVAIDCVPPQGGNIGIEPSHKELAPGETVRLRVRGRETLLGGFLHHITVNCTTPGRKQSFRIPVRGFIDSPLVMEKPASIIRGCEQAKEYSAALPFRLPPTIGADQLRFKCSDNKIAATVTTTTSKYSQVLNVHWKGEAEPGLYDYVLDITADAGEGAVVFRCRVGFEVVPKIEIYPSFPRINLDTNLTNYSRLFTLKVNHGSAAPTKVTVVGASHPAELFKLVHNGSGKWTALVNQEYVSHLHKDVVRKDNSTVLVRVTLSDGSIFEKEIGIQPSPHSLSARNPVINP